MVMSNSIWLVLRKNLFNPALATTFKGIVKTAFIKSKNLYHISKETAMDLMKSMSNGTIFVT